ncbi:MAG: substrate-binding domain-containing protein [Streptosporangiales bacterium]|nr:substrate-binding domain-containing protein [Streptosporangiales bacterium]
MNGIGRRAFAVGAAAALALGAAACGGESGGGGTTEQAKGGKIGLLLPETKTTRYEAFDRPLFEAKVKALCADCTIEYQNADQDANKQLSQAESMLTAGVKVLVLDAVDAKAAANIVTKAEQQGVPVVAYDRLASGPVDYYISFDNQKVGQLQGQALLDELKKGGDAKRGEVVMINGAPTDPNAADFKKGAHSVLDGQVTVGKEYDTPDWSPDKAQQQMEAAISAVGKDNIIGVYAANDGTGGGAIAAMKGAGFDKLPPVTGQDAELAAVQRILTGEQFMTVYKAIKPEAETAAQMAVDLAQGKKYAGKTTTMNNGDVDVPSVLLTPVAVTKDNVKDTVIADGFYKAADVCKDDAAKVCEELGIS